MAAKIPIAWVILLVILAVFGFFGYHILQASNPTGGPTHVNPVMRTLPEPAAPVEREAQSANPAQREVSRHEAHDSFDVADSAPAPVVHKQKPIPNRMPTVPGQSEEDLRSPEPLQRTPPSIQYDLPEASDPLNRTVNMESEFGSNLRHPEQMIEAGFTDTGEEFMKGIRAFDSGDVGSSFSLL